MLILKRRSMGVSCWRRTPIVLILSLSWQSVEKQLLSYVKCLDAMFLVM